MGNAVTSSGNLAGSRFATAFGTFAADRDAVLFVERLRNVLPDADIETCGSGLTIHPAAASGFPISMICTQDDPIVWFGTCLIEFGTIEQAFVWVLRACTRGSRLRVEMLGADVRSWALETQSMDGEWSAALSGGYSIFRPWSTQSIHILRNAHTICDPPGAHDVFQPVPKGSAACIS